MHVAILTIPGHGHVNPLLPIAAALARGGDRVSFVVPEGFAAAARAAGAEPVSLGDLPLPAGSGDPTSREGLEAGRRFFERVGVAMREAIAAVAASRPDVVLYDALLPMMGAGDVRGIDAPRVGFFPSFAIPEGARMSDLMALNPQVDAAAMLPHADEPAPAEPLTIVAIPRAYQPGGDSFDDRYLFVGPSLRDEGATDFPISPADGRPLVLVSLGTVASDKPAFFRAALDGLAARPWRAVVATGRADPTALGPLPAGVVARPHVPQLAVLRQADVFLTHGGMNSVMESLVLGVPMVVAPQAADQFANAGRVAELGLGRAVFDPAPTAAALLAALDAVLADPGYRERTRTMGADATAGGGAPRAAAAIRAYVGEVAAARA
jgi:MGT family glycosyltransferase